MVLPVPRVWEKFKAGLEARIEEIKKVISKAIVMAKKVEYEQRGERYFMVKVKDQIFV